MMNDTNPRAEKARLQALQAMSPARRLALAAGWSQSVREMTMQNMRRQHPEMSENGIHRLLVDRLLGSELAAKVYGPVTSYG
ncbi:hypothetical protein BH11VER1_BH11VER1_10350 [soil metagenome]